MTSDDKGGSFWYWSSKPSEAASPIGGNTHLWGCMAVQPWRDHCWLTRLDREREGESNCTRERAIDKPVLWPNIESYLSVLLVPHSRFLVVLLPLCVLLFWLLVHIAIQDIFTSVTISTIHLCPSTHVTFVRAVDVGTMEHAIFCTGPGKIWKLVLIHADFPLIYSRMNPSTNVKISCFDVSPHQVLSNAPSC